MADPSTAVLVAGVAAAATLLAASLAAAGALVGVIYGKNREQKDERRRWLRDREAQAYKDWVDAFQELRQCLKRIATLDRSTSDWLTERNRRRGLWSTYNIQFVQVEAYGSAGVYRQVSVADTRLRKLSAYVANAAQQSSNEWDSSRQMIDVAMRDAIDAIRRTLSLETLPSRAAWVAQASLPSEPVESDDPERMNARSETDLQQILDVHPPDGWRLRFITAGPHRLLVTSEREST